MTRHSSHNASLLSRRQVFFFAALLLFFAWVCAAAAQLPDVQQMASPDQPKAAPEAGASDTEGSVDEHVAKTQQKLDAATERLKNAKVAETAGAAMQFGVSEDAVEEQTRLLQGLVRVFEKHLDALRKLKETRRSRHDLDAEIAAWRGFAEPPPYAIDLVDGLRDGARTEQLEIQAAEAEGVFLDHVLEATQQSLSKAEQELDAAGEAAGAVVGQPEAARRKWLQELAEIRVQCSRAAINEIKTEQQVLDETIALHRNKLGFVQRNLEVASAHAPFTKEELDAKLEGVDGARASIEKELVEGEEVNNGAQKALEKARLALQTAREARVTEGPEAEKNAEEIGHLQAVVDTRKAQADTAELVVKGLKFFIDTRNTEESTWKDRFEAAHNPDYEKLNETADTITGRLQRIDQWKPYFDSNLQLTQAQISDLEQRLANWQPEQGDKALAQQTLEAYKAREKLFTRGLARLHEIEQMLLRWQWEVNAARHDIPFGERVKGFLSAGYALGERIWNYQVFTVADKGITAGKIAMAFLILVVGFVLSRRCAVRVRQLTTDRLRLEEGVAAPVEKAVHYALLVIVVLFALHVVKIPLTIFAYMGGALAIGVGFGAQRLINDFLSGLILLLERPIKVGDIVELDGKRGRVANIGARCSQVRGFDGIDMLVPNSAFLEKNVTNWTLSDRTIRRSVSVGVAYGSPAREVSRLIANAVEEHGQILKYPEPVVLFEDFGENALVFTVYFWVDVSADGDTRVISSDIRYMIDKLFREAGITMAFPQRDVHLDSTRPIPVTVVNPEPPVRE